MTDNNVQGPGLFAGEQGDNLPSVLERIVGLDENGATPIPPYRRDCFDALPASVCACIGSHAPECELPDED